MMKVSSRLSLDNMWNIQECIKAMHIKKKNRTIKYSSRLCELCMISPKGLFTVLHVPPCMRDAYIRAVYSSKSKFLKLS